MINSWREKKEGENMRKRNKEKGEEEGRKVRDGVTTLYYD